MEKLTFRLRASACLPKSRLCDRPTTHGCLLATRGAAFSSNNLSLIDHNGAIVAASAGLWRRAVGRSRDRKSSVAQAAATPAGECGSGSCCHEEDELQAQLQRLQQQLGHLPRRTGNRDEQLLLDLCRGDTSAAPPDRRAAEVQRLLDAGVCPNVADRDRRTPLHHAAFRGYPDIMRMLLTAGAQPNVTDKSGETPLIAAAKVERLGIARLLLAHGACPDPRDGHGMAAADYLPELAAHVEERRAQAAGGGAGTGQQRQQEEGVQWRRQVV